MDILLLVQNDEVYYLPKILKIIKFITERKVMKVRKVRKVQIIETHTYFSIA